MSRKYWDIIVPPKPDKSRDYTADQIKTLELLKNHKTVSRTSSLVKNFGECLHNQCPTCHGSGRDKRGVVCIHMLHCNCNSCSPTL